MINYHSNGYKLILLFCFSNSALWSVCIVHSRVCCSAEFCSPYVHSTGTMQLLQLQSLELAKGEGTRAFTALASGLLLFVLHGQNSCFQSWKQFFSALVQDEFLDLWDVVIQAGKFSVEHKVIIMNMLLVTAEGQQVQDGVWRQT